MVASGIPNRNGEKHVQEIALLSLDLLHTIEKMVVKTRAGDRLALARSVAHDRENGGPSSPSRENQIKTWHEYRYGMNSLC